MLLNDEDIQEFIEICGKDGVELTPKEARPIATRLALLFRHLAKPLPRQDAGLAKSGSRATVKGPPTHHALGS
ncbi:MAG: hypothetical protein JOZ54_21705 [Acidobacteria bacterium]|nr:hypothetical protein [Acidobacteriota bacterium]